MRPETDEYLYRCADCGISAHDLKLLAYEIDQFSVGPLQREELDIRPVNVGRTAADR